MTFFGKIEICQKKVGSDGHIWRPFASWVDRANKYRSGESKSGPQDKGKSWSSWSPPWEGKGRKDGEDWWATKGAAKDHGGGWAGKGEDVEIAGWEDVSGRR